MKKSIFGFTLIELLVVIAIMVTLVAVVIPQFISFNSSQGLQNAAATLQTSLRTVQNNATAGMVSSKCSPPAAASKWLVEFVYNKSYKISSICQSGITPTPAPVAVDTINFPPEITISVVKLDDCVINFSTSSPKVLFANISGNVSFDDDSGGCPATGSTTTMAIILSSASSGETATVKVKKGGIVTVE